MQLNLLKLINRAFKKTLGINPKLLKEGGIYTVTFSEKGKDVNRIFIYRDKELRKQPYAVKVFNDFKDVVRVESNHAQLKSLRQLYGSTNLLDILGSNARVNYQRFTSITAKTTDIRLFTEFEGMKWNEIVKREGFRGICERCNMDWFLIDRFIRIHNTNNYRSVRPELRAYYNTLNQNTRIVEFDVVQHIKELLYAA
jgi:hypothetical protein